MVDRLDASDLNNKIVAIPTDNLKHNLATVVNGGSLDAQWPLSYSSGVGGFNDFTVNFDSLGNGGVIGEP